jgi:hypothetical protein
MNGGEKEVGEGFGGGEDMGAFKNTPDVLCR